MTLKNDIGGVCFMTNEYPPNIYGGAGVHVDYLTRSLAKLIDVEVRCFGSRTKTESPLAVTGYEPWEEMARGSDPKLRKVLEPMSVNLAMAKDPIRASIVHCHTWYTFFAGYLVKKLYGSRLITTAHSLEPLRAWKQEQLGRGYLVSSDMERLGIETSDRVIAVSKGMKQDILANFNVPEHRVEVVYNGIDLKEYSPTPKDEALKRYGIRKPYILFVGRLTKQKGIVHLLDAFPHVSPGVNLVLCAGSPDTAEIAEEVSYRVKNMERVVWIDKMLPKDEVIQLYSHASVFACPSIYEPFGIINLEAMACGAPVVASRVGGIPEVVQDGETGILVDPGQPEALARGINEVLEREDLARQFSAKAKRRVEAMFSWDAIAERTIEVYRNALVNQS